MRLSCLCFAERSASGAPHGSMGCQIYLLYCGCSPGCGRGKASSCFERGEQTRATLASLMGRMGRKHVGMVLSSAQRLTHTSGCRVQGAGSVSRTCFAPVLFKSWERKRERRPADVRVWHWLGRAGTVASIQWHQSSGTPAASGTGFAPKWLGLALARASPPLAPLARLEPLEPLEPR